MKKSAGAITPLHVAKSASVEKRRQPQQANISTASRRTAAQTRHLAERANVRMQQNREMLRVQRHLGGGIRVEQQACIVTTRARLRVTTNIVVVVF